MTVSISKMSIDYYLATAAGGDGAQLGNAKDLTSYYTESGDPAGTWFGSGLESTGMAQGQQVESWAAKKLYQDMIDPYTGKPLGRPPIKEQAAPEGAKTPKGEQAKPTRKPVHGFDLTFSAPKSVSALWAVADPELQGRIHKAHQDAIAETLAWAEKNVIQTRAGHGGVAHVATNGIVGSLFDHSDSRLGDPQLHTHAVIHNRVQRTSDGQWTTIDSYTLHRHVVAISERYNSLLFDRLYQAAGAVAEVRDQPTAVAAHQLQEFLDQHDQLATQTDYEPYNARVELDGIPDDLIDEFSTRSRLIRERKDELIKEWCETNGQEEPPRHIVLRLRQQATLETREPKDTDSPASLSEKMTSWRERTKALHYDPAKLVQDSTGNETPVITSVMIEQPIIDRLGHWVLTDTGMRRTTFTRANIMASAERILRSVRCHDATDREQLADRITEAALAQAVSLTPERDFAPRLGLDPALTLRGESIFNHKRHAGVYTTTQVMADEEFLMGRTTEAATKIDADTLPDKVAQLRTADGHELSSDQAAATIKVLSSGNALDAIIGPAGTGKTTTMKAIRDLWTEQHGDAAVIGLAPSAVAAGVLGDEIQAPTDNTAKWLYESVGEGAVRRIGRIQNQQAALDLLNQQVSQASGKNQRSLLKQIDAVTTKLAADYAAQAKYTMHENQLVIIDEASMVGTATLAELNRQAAAANAKVLLVGDPRQLDAIDAGGFLGWMEREANVANLNQVWRFRDEGQAPSPEHWEAKASLQLRSANVDSEEGKNILAVYEEHGRIIGDEDSDATETAYQAWITDTLKGMESLMVGATNEQVRDMNTKAQLDLVDAGRVDLDTVVKLREETQAGIGDIVLARKNNRNLRDSNGAFIANGVRIRITEISDDGSAIGHRTDNDATITLDADYLANSVELGYASTAHRAQGVTVDTCHTIAQSGIPRELFYVAMTRGKHGNYVYVDIPEEEETPDQWGIMRKVQPEKRMDVLAGILRNETATKTAHEVQNAEHGWAKDFGRMAHEAVYLADLARSTRTIDWITEHYGQEHLAELQSSESWQQLVRADLPSTLTTPPDKDDITIAELLTYARTQEEPDAICHVVPAWIPANEAQRDTATQLAASMGQRLDDMTEQAINENSAWVQAVQEQFPENVRQAVRIHCAWRSVSDQDDAAKPLASAPDPQKNRYMHAFYLRTLRELAPLKQQAAGLQEPEIPSVSPENGRRHPETTVETGSSRSPQQTADDPYDPCQDVLPPAEEPSPWEDVPLDAWDEATIYEDMPEVYTDFSDFPGLPPDLVQVAPSARPSEPGHQQNPLPDRTISTPDRNQGPNIY
ncbi:MobF family relaxase [Glutamicibacter arilaitensis]|uniref:MobF family relaxase n=1 Tax=Glutamicibacter arilaitensis TaxID=256701 RepID=UPI003FD0D363